MGAYPYVYLQNVVESQGKLFDLVAQRYPDADTNDFICTYMRSATRASIDVAQAYVCTMDAPTLWEYFCKTEEYKMVPGKALEGFAPDWVGEFYAYYQWYYDIPSSRVINEITVDFLLRAYGGLHDLDLDLAVEKVGAPR